MSRPAKPWSPEYAVALRYLDALRRRRAEASRPRSSAYVEACAEVSLLVDLAEDLGLPSLTIAGRIVLELFPIAPGPDWIHEAAGRLAGLLEKEPVR